MSTATDRAAMLAAICDDPHDTGLRLIFADWLDDNGEPDRAEFIRVQCRFLDETVEAMGFPVPGPRPLMEEIAALRRRERELFRALERWKAGLPALQDGE